MLSRCKLDKNKSQGWECVKTPANRTLANYRTKKEEGVACTTDFLLPIASKRRHQARRITSHPAVQPQSH
jgi:ribosomal protein L34E